MSVAGSITGVPMIPIVLGMSVQPISDCKKGVWTWRLRIGAPLLASSVRIQFWDEARNKS